LTLSVAFVLVASSTIAPLAAQDDANALVEKLLEHVRRIDAHADELQVPDFPAGKEWFNSPPLSMKRELAGKIVVLDFWTYCCINCIHVLPDLAALEKKYAAYPVAFVGVHSAKFDNEKVSENIRQAVLRYEIEHPVLNDDAMELWGQVGVQSWPTLAVVGPRGNLLLRQSGEGQRDVIDACIAAALKFYPADSFRHDPVPVRLERERERRTSPLSFPGKLAVDTERGRLYISDSNHNRIVVTDLVGKFVDAIGSGRLGLRDGDFDAATFNRLQGLALDGRILWVADAENHALRRVDLDKRAVTTVAGDGAQGRDYRGGKKGRRQQLSTPWDVVVHRSGEDDVGRVFIAMAGTHQIWVHDIAKGTTRNFSGTGHEQNLNSPDRLRAAWAQPSGLTIGGGRLFVADSESSSVRSVDLASGETATIVGGDDSKPRDLFAFGDVDGTGDAARLQHCLGVQWLAATKRVAVADTYNHRLKLVDPAHRSVTAWIGSGAAGLVDGRGLEARFAEPSGFALDRDGSRLWVADTNNHAIRVVDVRTGDVSTLELVGVPLAKAAVDPRSVRLATLPGTPTVRVAGLRLAPGAAGEIVLDLELPDGHHYSDGAGSRWQILFEQNAPLTIADEHASGRLESDDPIVVRVRAPKRDVAGSIRVEALAYFCDDKKTCQVGAVVFEVPVEIASPANGASQRPRAELKHTFAVGATKLFR